MKHAVLDTPIVKFHKMCEDIDIWLVGSLPRLEIEKYLYRTSAGIVLVPCIGDRAHILFKYLDTTCARLSAMELTTQNFVSFCYRVWKNRITTFLSRYTSKSRDGTYHFNCLATINCTVEGSRAFLGATLVRRMDSLSDTVSKLIDGCTKKGIRIGVLTVDKEFFSTGVKLRSKKQFLMPATKTKGIKKAISEFEAGKRDAVSQHVLTSSVAGKEPEKFTLIILEREEEK